MDAIIRVVSRLRQNTEGPLNLSDMAKIASMSRFHFDRLFRRVTSLPPRQFQSALRIADAKRLLLTSDMTALDICLTIGYSSLGTFTRRFSEMVGMPPTGLRRLMFVDLTDGLNRGLETAKTTPSRSGTILGTLLPSTGFSGVALVGLYPTPAPQGAPLACALVESAAPEFRLSGLASGEYYLLAAVIEIENPDPMSILLGDVAAVGRESVKIDSDDMKQVRIRLRSPRITDPPLLTAVAPFIVRQYLVRGLLAIP
jgi:AraC-like DNA-binding protein